MPTVIVIDDAIQLIDEPITHVRTIRELARLQRTIQDYLQAHGLAKPADRIISSIEAREIAGNRGYSLPATSLINAYARGNILGAQKVAGSNRWESPESSFLAWLDRWAARDRKKAKKSKA